MAEAVTAEAGGVSGEGHWGRLAAITVAACTLGWILTLRNEFVFDDFAYVVSNPWIRDWRNLPRLLFSMDGNSYNPDVPLWRPLRNLHYLIDYTIAGLRPWWYHAMNVLWHGATVAGLFVLLKRLGLAPIGVVAACLFFGLHPVQAESVAWVKERDGLMSTAFLFWALVLTLERGWGSAAGALACVAGALLSKENTVVFLPLAVVALWVDGRWPAARRDVVVLVLAGLLTVLFLVARHAVMGQTSQVAQPIGGTMAATLWGMGAIFLRYIQLVVLPVDMQLFYHHLRPQQETLLAAVGHLSILMLLGAGLWLAWRRHLAGFAILLYLIALFPYSNVVPMMQWMAVRFLYVSLAGAAALVGLAVVHLQRSAAGRWAWPVVGVVGLVLLASAAERSLVWESQLTVWRDSYLANPENEMVAISYADALVTANLYEEAASVMPAGERFEGPRRLRSEVAWKVRLMLLNHEGRLEEASRVAEEAVGMFPQFAELQNIQAFVLMRRGMLAEAAAVWEAMLLKHPFHISGRQNLARAYEDLGRREEANRQRELLRRLNSVPRSEWGRVLREAGALEPGPSSSPGASSAP